MNFGGVQATSWPQRLRIRADLNPKLEVPRCAVRRAAAGLQREVGGPKAAGRHRRPPAMTGRPSVQEIASPMTGYKVQQTYPDVSAQRRNLQSGRSRTLSCQQASKACRTSAGRGSELALPTQRRLRRSTKVDLRRRHSAVEPSGPICRNAGMRGRRASARKDPDSCWQSATSCPDVGKTASLPGHHPKPNAAANRPSDPRTLCPRR